MKMDLRAGATLRESPSASMRAHRSRRLAGSSSNSRSGSCTRDPREADALLHPTQRPLITSFLRPAIWYDADTSAMIVLAIGVVFAFFFLSFKHYVLLQNLGLKSRSRSARRNCVKAKLACLESWNTVPRT